MKDLTLATEIEAMKLLMLHCFVVLSLHRFWCPALTIALNHLLYIFMIDLENSNAGSINQVRPKNLQQIIGIV
jgi:hypothetical protein